jgi:hypothetical protein
VATVVVSALIGWAGAGLAAADNKWDGDPGSSNWDGVVLLLDNKWD